MNQCTYQGKLEGVKNWVKNPRQIISRKFEGAKPLQEPLLPLSFEGEGDKGGEVDK